MPYKGPSIFDIHAKIEFFTPCPHASTLFPRIKIWAGKMPFKGKFNG